MSKKMFLMSLSLIAGAAVANPAQAEQAMSFTNQQFVNTDSNVSVVYAGDAAISGAYEIVDGVSIGASYMDIAEGYIGIGAKWRFHETQSSGLFSGKPGAFAIAFDYVTGDLGFDIDEEAMGIALLSTSFVNDSFSYSTKIGWETNEVSGHGMSISDDRFAFGIGGHFQLEGFYADLTFDYAIGDYVDFIILTPTVGKVYGDFDFSAGLTWVKLAGDADDSDSEFVIKARYNF
ncbi:hypothetical protein [Ferrimonas marina]|uniref:Porin n=1 Tax=Ferrimonas marina TaxID=299255 RepID=A0A1M5T5P5_9GAMM|nr:hypothetical protein [Ferrimonas marina]SHH46075.1 hypothetical protein SAMN02745129_2012 [Ferrimonas marina]